MVVASSTSSSPGNVVTTAIVCGGEKTRTTTTTTAEKEDVSRTWFRDESDTCGAENNYPTQPGTRDVRRVRGLPSYARPLRVVSFDRWVREFGRVRVVEYGKKMRHKLYCVNKRKRLNVRSVCVPPGPKRATIIVGSADTLVCNMFSEFGPNVVVG